MKKFIVIYYAPTSTREQMEKSTPEDMKNGMKPWMEWKERIGSGMVDMGTPLGHAMKVTKSDTMPGDTSVVGYSVLQADNIDEAVKMLQGLPHLMWVDGCEIEVHESMPMPGM